MEENHEVVQTLIFSQRALGRGERLWRKACTTQTEHTEPWHVAVSLVIPPRVPSAKESDWPSFCPGQTRRPARFISFHYRAASRAKLCSSWWISDTSCLPVSVGFFCTERTQSYTKKKPSQKMIH